MYYILMIYWNEAEPLATPENIIEEHFAFAKLAHERGAYVASELTYSAAWAKPGASRAARTVVR
ncbi:MAG: hypothetical protein WD939_00715 [Dehalococcoidia bacterium]